jgi:hypothetical protein
MRRVKIFINPVGSKDMVKVRGTKPWRRGLGLWINNEIAVILKVQL